jgi:hypothetical protein
VRQRENTENGTPHCDPLREAVAMSLVRHSNLTSARCGGVVSTERKIVHDADANGWPLAQRLGDGWLFLGRGEEPLWSYPPRVRQRDLKLYSSRGTREGHPRGVGLGAPRSRV